MAAPSTATSVLLIDAFGDEGEMYAEYLCACGFTTRICRDPQEAIDQATEAAPDVVVTRFRQQGALTGIDVARHLKAHEATRNVPIVMITASMDPAHRDAAFQAGCDGYLLLPTLPDALATELRRVLSLRRVTRPRPAHAELPGPAKSSGTSGERPRNAS